MSRTTVVSILIRGKSRRRARANFSKSEILESSKSDLGKKYQSRYIFLFSKSLIGNLIKLVPESVISWVIVIQFRDSETLNFRGYQEKSCFFIGNLAIVC